jgi:streptogramin lyase
MRRLRALLLVVPVVAAVAIAGTVSSPDDVRPCITEFADGITGNPTHLVSSPDGNLYANEETTNRILRFNPQTHEGKEYGIGTSPHDLTVGPDGRIWFVSALEDDLGALDPETGDVEHFEGITRKSEPHMLRWLEDGRLYITEAKAGRLAVFDPDTEKIREDDFGLPPGNFIHNVTVLPDGDFWAVLQEGDALAHFDLEKQRFDEIVPVPVKDSGPRDLTYVKSRNALYATLFAANQIVEYDLDTKKLTLYPTHVDPISYETAQSEVATGRASDGSTKTAPKLTFVRQDAEEEAVWVSTLAGGELLRLDLESAEITRVGCGFSIPQGPLGLANDAQGQLWVAQAFPVGKIARVDR